jgi:hypothetical protein
MSELLNLSQVDIWTYQILLIDLAVAVLMIAGLRYIRGLVTNVDSTEELASKDNFAFGVAMAGGTLALALMLTGAVSGEPGATLVAELTSVISYGVLGLILLWVGRLGQDKLVLRGIEIQEQIKQGNLSSALVDVANTVATGLVLRAVMIWVESETLDGLIMVLAAFVITQILLSAVTRYRLMVYSRRHEGESLQAAFEAGNVALSIRYLGHISGVALAVTAASGVAAYNSDALVVALLTWVAVSIIFTVLVSILAIFARKVILAGVDVVDEVDNQKNVGVAAVEAAIYLSIGLFFTALFA